MSGTDGVLVIDKPPGMTSHDVVDEVRRRLKVKRVGHAGTLDPDATGVLVVGVGSATRLLDYAKDRPKRYRAGARFGITTTTQDASGDIVAMRDASGIDRSAVEAAARALTGEILQVPPMVSAVKIGGERLYEKARRGEDVERAPRPVTVFRFDVVAFDPGDEPGAAFDVECSAGTYVRTLVYDLGERVGVGAHLVSLRRTAAAGFTLDDALPLSEVGPDAVRPLVDAVGFLARLEVCGPQERMVSNGRALDPDKVDGAGKLAEGDNVALVRDVDGRLLAVYRLEHGELKPERVIPR